MSKNTPQQTKFKLVLKKRIPLVLTLAFLSIAFSIDFMLSLRIEDMLREKPRLFTVELEADMCNALTNREYFGVRLFLDRVIANNIENYELVSGECQRGMKTTLKVTKKPQ